MTETPTAPGTPASAGTPRTQYPQTPTPRHTERSGWSGWIIFAGVMLMLVGTFQLIAGLVALLEDDYYAVTKNGLVVHMSFTGWGWVHIGLAAINIAAGFGVVTGRGWARVWAIIVASLSAIVNIGFLAASPVWVVTMVTLDVIVIYALCVHWDEMKQSRLDR